MVQAIACRHVDLAQRSSGFDRARPAGRPAGRATEIELLVDQLTQAEVLGQSGRRLSSFEAL